ncbi:hypothetical protein [Sandaracinus amylolyticus]|uniref:hypothetical protein n=1 Tax=Sandaracinus amylolyticus TaxID=927083 RepID=UPI001F48FAE4|nr:hypothetical protein [Sandaracinus amylolyticus]
MSATSLLTACGLSTTSAAPEASPPETLIARLESYPALDVIGVHSDAEVVMRLPLAEAEGTPIALVVDYGEATIGARGTRTLVLEDLLFAFERVDVPADRLPPNGLSFDEIRVRALGPVEAHVSWASTSEARALAIVDLELDWRMVLPDGQTHRLGTERIEDVEVALRVLLDSDGRVIADVDLSLERVWQWAGVVELEQLDVHLVTRERLPVAPHWAPPVFE